MVCMIAEYAGGKRGYYIAQNTDDQEQAVAALCRRLSGRSLTGITVVLEDCTLAQLEEHARAYKPGTAYLHIAL